MAVRPMNVPHTETEPRSPWRPALWSLGIAAAIWATYPLGLVLGMIAGFIPLVSIIPYLAPFAVAVYTFVLAARSVERRRPWPGIVGFLGASATTAYAFFYAGVLTESLANLGG